jgi:hypothetical protein
LTRHKNTPKHRKDLQVFVTSRFKTSMDAQGNPN